jgi:hypothetical protein
LGTSSDVGWAGRGGFAADWLFTVVVGVAATRTDVLRVGAAVGPFGAGRLAGGLGSLAGLGMLARTTGVEAGAAEPETPAGAASLVVAGRSACEVLGSERTASGRTATWAPGPGLSGWIAVSSAAD